MATSPTPLFRRRAATPLAPLAAPLPEAGEEGIDAWTQRWRRNEFSFLGNRVEELEQTLRRRTVMLGSTTLLCLAAAVTFAILAFAEGPLDARMEAVVERLRAATLGRL
jgi:hypothetical protein